MFYLLSALFLLIPTYVIRFNIGVPVNLLEILSLAFLLIFAVLLKKNNLVGEFKQHVAGQPRAMLVLAGLFLLAGLISAFISPNKSRGAGLFVVMFLLPILVYMPASYIFSQPENKSRFVKLLFGLVALLSTYGIIQYLTLLGLPEAWRGNPDEPKRALSFFVHPNDFALFITPILAFLCPFFFEKKIHPSYKACYLVGLVGLLLSLSRGGWFGILGAAVVFVIFFARKRIALLATASLIILLLFITMVPSLNLRLKSTLEGDRSSASRYSLWETGSKMISDSPVFGKGLYGFKSNYEKYNADPSLPSINFPHNIFLNFWVETGLLGLVSFILISLLAIYRSLRLGGSIAIGIILFIVALFIHGLVDTPYLKNDLALAFWVILALQS